MQNTFPALAKFAEKMLETKGEHFCEWQQLDIDEQLEGAKAMISDMPSLIDDLAGYIVEDEWSGAAFMRLYCGEGDALFRRAFETALKCETLFGGAYDQTIDELRAERAA